MLSVGKLVEDLGSTAVGADGAADADVEEQFVQEPADVPESFVQDAAAAEVAKGEAEEESDEEIVPSCGNREMLLKNASSAAHLAHHMPKNPLCQICQLGKAKARPARRLKKGF